MRHMKLNSRVKQTKPSKRQALQESGQTLHEVLIASSILAMTISGFSSGIIRSNNITHQASLRKAAESRITNDLESNVKRRFYTFRCRQGPCKDAIEENDKSLMYYDRKDSDDKKEFIKQCKGKNLAKELLSKDKNSEDKNKIGIGKHEVPIRAKSLLDNNEIKIIRTISLVDHTNQAIIVYEAKKDNEIIATIKTRLVPNAVHWCS